MANPILDYLLAVILIFALAFVPRGANSKALTALCGCLLAIFAAVGVVTAVQHVRGF